MKIKRRTVRALAFVTFAGVAVGGVIAWAKSKTRTLKHGAFYHFTMNLDGSELTRPLIPKSNAEIADGLNKTQAPLWDSASVTGSGALRTVRLRYIGPDGRPWLDPLRPEMMRGPVVEETPSILVLPKEQAAFHMQLGHSYKLTLGLRSALKAASNATLAESFVKGDSKGMLEKVAVTGAGKKRSVSFVLKHLPSTDDNPSDFLKQSPFPAAGSVSAFAAA